MKLNSSFKYAAIGIAIVTALLLWRDSFLKEQRKENAKVYEIERQVEEKQRIEDEEKQQALILEKADIIDSKSTQINRCIKQVKFVKTETILKEDDIFIDYIGYLSAKMQDSTKRADKDDSYVLAKINDGNSLFLKANQTDQNPFDFKQLMQPKTSSLEDRKKGPMSYYIFANSANRTTLLKKVDNLKYLVLIQTTKKLNPIVLGEDGFDAGYLVAKLSYFDIENGKLLEEKTVVGTNSTSISVRSGMGSSYLGADLHRNFKKELSRFITGNWLNK